jgi:heme oxygenase
MVEGTPALDVIAALRGATHTRHERLDTRMPLAQADATLADYRDHLTLLLRWLTPLARWSAMFDDGPQDDALLPPLATLAQIEADLRDPSLAGGADSAAGDDAARWRSPRSAAYRWGVAYVIEGSRLGGAVLYRRLAAQLAPHPLAYLQGSSAGPGPRWQAFLRSARAQVVGEAAIAEACAGACDAFDSIIGLLDAAGARGAHA